MDRIFLDANVLLSAAWRSAAAIQRLWRLEGVELLSSGYQCGGRPVIIQPHPPRIPAGPPISMGLSEDCLPGRIRR